MPKRINIRKINTFLISLKMWELLLLSRFFRFKSRSKSYNL
ncbi:hypothetical protein G436_2621 [Leptospira interrogans serovar Hardjo str. Norma]|uniref:Uncharacterized protein n=1 Tax=Leptospira interrogans serovar Hardjo str. Norma TaxID=1279460 RepID=A0A0M3TLW2_LEPIR|nr:hypothetical protein G436_2621 [Leptospira interrogans serovar Hardjo str. Norma]